MRGMLTRLLQDTASTPEWSVAEKDELINLGLLEAETRVLVVDPAAFISVDTFDQVANQERYDKPAGFLFEYELAIKDSGQATGWRALPRGTYRGTRGRVASATVEYASLGRYFYLSPIPSTSVDEGFRLTWVYPISVSADSDVPLLALPLHRAAVDWATGLALAETSEREAMDAAFARAEKAFERIPVYYRRSRVPQGITPLVRDAASRLRLARDVYLSG